MVFSGIFRVSSIELSNYFQTQPIKATYFQNDAKIQLKKNVFRRKIKTHKITNFLVKIIRFSYD